MGDRSRSSFNSKILRYKSRLLLSIDNMKDRSMKRIRRYWLVAAMVVVSCVGTFGIGHFWNKSDYCGGWADHYRVRSSDLETQMLVMLTMNRDADAKEIAIRSRQDRLIAEKYESVAEYPILPYPKAPLISPSEQKKIETEAEWLVAGQHPIPAPPSRTP